MSLQETLELQIKKAVNQLYQADLETVEFQATRKEFKGNKMAETAFEVLDAITKNLK